MRFVLNFFVLFADTKSISKKYTDCVYSTVVLDNKIKGLAT
jgi:hypothetical protein